SAWALGHRLAMTADPAGPTPSSRHTVRFHLFFPNPQRISALRGTPNSGRSWPQALTAGYSGRSASRTGLIVCLDIDLQPPGGPAALLVGQHFAKGRRHVRAGVYEPPAFDAQQHVTVFQGAEAVGNQERGAAAHEALHGLHDGG